MIFKKKLYIKGMDLKQNNNRRLISLIAPLAIGFSLCACGGSEVAGGGPSGTEAGNAITAQILIANAPAANARVKLVEHNSLDGQGYTATTNDSGYVTIENVAIGNYTMEASLDESALALQLPVDVKDTVSNVALGQQNLQKSVFIGGSIADFIDDTTESIKNMNGFVKFRGLDHSAAITNGKFEIFGLPAGHLNMVIIPTETADTVKVSVETDAGDSVTTLKPQDSIPPTPVSKNERLLIDDFEDGDNFHIYVPENIMGYSGYYWLLLTTTLANTIPFIAVDTINVYPEIPQDLKGKHPFIAVIQDDNEGGKEVNVKFDFPETSIGEIAPFAFIKLYFKGMYTTTDLSMVDSVAFDAWGSGNAEIQILDEANGVTLTAYPITLPKSKAKLQYAWADLLPNEEDRKKVSSFSIVFHDDGELHFDNFELIGQNLQDIWKSKE
ncbi:MAG: carboxypeptidase regulatory-like domain-containing protein [Fibrobacter sp.]|nr:carboxypeptidase regulatory-like domain-containing protein [Fibrobacter sp.]